MKLSKTQEEVLDKMELNQWYSARALKVSLATLGALEKKGMVEKKLELGYMFYPRLHTKFRKVEMEG